MIGFDEQDVIASLEELNKFKKHNLKVDRDLGSSTHIENVSYYFNIPRYHKRQILFYWNVFRNTETVITQFREFF